MKYVVVVLMLFGFSTFVQASDLDDFFAEITGESQVVETRCWMNGTPSDELRLHKFSFRKDVDGDKLWSVSLHNDEIKVRKVISDETEYEISENMLILEFDPTLTFSILSFKELRRIELRIERKGPAGISTCHYLGQTLFL